MSGLVYELKLTHRYRNGAKCVTHRHRLRAWDDDDMQRQIKEMAAYENVPIAVETIGKWED